MKEAKPNRSMLFCEPCGFKKIIEPEQEELGLTEIKRPSVQGGIPQLDATFKTTTKAAVERKRMYKCPRCGRGVQIKELSQSYTKVLNELDQRKERERIEKDRLKRIEDGKPLEKKADPNFLG